MKSHAFFLTLLLTPLTGFAQGPLTPPPGAPAPSMKSLDQIEARTPITSLPFSISVSGSYYLAKNLQFDATSGDAISITAPNVTLDLNGFTISSTDGVTGNAIKVSDNLNNIAIKNGNITSNTSVSKSGSAPNQTWTVTAVGFARGIYALASTTSYRNMTVENLQVSGCRNEGILAYYSTVTGSTVTSNGNAGIYAWEGSVNACTAKANGSHGISASNVTGSIAKFNGSNGILASTVMSSEVRYNGRDGIQAIGGSITGCVAQSNHNSAGTYYDLNATDAAIASTKYGTGNVTGSTFDGERRIAIESLPYTISTSGSYYLTKNLEFDSSSGNAISITSNNVTLDLNGFTLSSTTSVIGKCISIGDELTNILIQNGMIAGNTVVTISGSPRTWTPSSAGFSNGIYGGSNVYRNLVVNNVQVSGCRSSGIYAAFGNVTNCSSRSNGSNGINAFMGGVSNSIGTSNVSHGITAYNGSIAGSTGTNNGSDGINCDTGSIIGCSGYSNGGSGVRAPGSLVKTSLAYDNGAAGIWADNSVISDCKVSNSGSDGIRGVNSTISTCKSSGSDQNTGDSYTGSGIYWSGGRQVDNVSDSYSPVAPAP